MRVAGSDDSSANYAQQQITATSTTVGGFRNSGQQQWIETIYIESAFQNPATFNLFNPFNTRVTSGYQSEATTVNGASISLANWTRGLNTTTSYTGFTFFPTTGGATITGSVSVYGYNK